MELTITSQAPEITVSGLLRPWRHRQYALCAILAVHV